MAPASLSAGTPFMQHLLLWLAPFFQAFSANGETLDPGDIYTTLTAYGAQTRVEMLHAALALAFNLSALDTLARAEADPDMSATLRLRHRACANALHRSAARNTQAIAAQRRCDEPTQPGKDNQAGKDNQPARNNLTQAELDRLLDEAQATLTSGLNRLKPPPVRPGAHPNRRETGFSHLFNAMSPPAPAHTMRA